MFHTQTDTSYLIGLIIMAIVTGLFLAGGLIWWGWDGAGTMKHPRRGLSFLQGAGFTLAGWIVCWGLFAWAAWPPLPGAYNSYQPVTGTVKQVSSRFIAGEASGSGSTQKFAVQLTSGQTYGCNDTRCSVLKPGQDVTLLCEKVFQFNAAEGWDCNFGKYGLNKEGS